MLHHQEPAFDMCFNGRFGDLKGLLSSDKQLILKTDNDDMMLIHWATLGGHNDIVKHLLSIGSPVDPQDDTKVTPLICATVGGFIKVIEILIANGANVNAQTTEGNSALHEACRQNQKKICSMLIKKSADINIIDNRGATPLHRAAAKGNLDALKVLLAQKDLNIDAQNKHGNTALHFACHNGFQQTSRLLMCHRASLKLKNAKGKTPLELASKSLRQKLQSRFKKY